MAAQKSSVPDFATSRPEWGLVHRSSGEKRMKKQLIYLGISATMVLGLLTLVKAARDGGQPPKDEAPPRTAASRIVQVTVYPNVALVTREVDVPAGVGSMELRG